MHSDPGFSRVLLLHGLWMGPWVLRPLARRLRAAGFDVDRFGYASIRGGPEPAIAALAARLHGQAVAGIVAHSLGGLIALETLRRHPEFDVRRVVCLGSPLAGSVTAGQGLAERLAGRSAALLREGVPAWQGRAEVGVIAGTIALGAGRLFGRVNGPNDGTVAVAETKLPGLADHITLATTHTGLLLSPDVARQCAAFLREGRFRAKKET